MASSDTPSPSLALQQACGTGFMATGQAADPAAAGALVQLGFTEFGAAVSNYTQVQLLFQATPIIASAAISEASGPILIIGVTIPFVILGLLLAGLRLRRIVNVRSATVFVAEVCHAIWVASQIAAIRMGGFGDKTADYVAVGSFMGMLILTAYSGLLRGSQVIINEEKRKRVRQIGAAVLFLFGIGFFYEGYSEVHNSTSSPTRFSNLFCGLPFIPIGLYIVCGTLAFSWNLPKESLNNVSGGFSRLKTMRVMNDAMGAAVIFFATTELVIMFPLQHSNYFNPMATLNMTGMLFVENLFETVSTVLQSDLFKGARAFAFTSSGAKNNVSVQRMDTVRSSAVGGQSKTNLVKGTPKQTHGAEDGV
ncbi:uncharacterized protein EV422DRAFT_522471 [Fimicolochytrium jonesii]|uniref:uncharacterized protein n=1 Tax=Fimicolochytrium jonesii TaxID=1396493 RepID=UPI0022FDC4E1|nr:uncharacterized protein EV422DRAFT_522471 [Fimicolochytrium jonesii]KAI8822872.1 hypothetical protein EV422DRAFT_522471 [Fimicolochytrium jonesii]